METTREINLIMIFGLLISAVLILMSVDYLFANQKYIELIMTAILFSGIVLLIRSLKLKYEEKEIVI